MNRFKLTQRVIFIDEILEAIKEERVYKIIYKKILDVFGTGTAVNI